MQDSRSVIPDLSLFPAAVIEFITDSGNHRVLILDSENQLLLAVGSFCNIENVESDSCIDPDGNGPLSRGDGQFSNLGGCRGSER